MANTDRERQRDIPVTTEKKIEELHELIDGIEVAMMTTRRADGSLVSRPMQTQDRDDQADLWYVTDIETHKLDELAHDPHVNLAFYQPKTKEWVSVSGVVRVSQDRALIRRLYDRSWKVWFPDDGPGRDGGPDDPRIAVLCVDTDSVTYMTVDKPKPAVLYEIAKGYVTGKEPDVGRTERLSEGELGTR
ncbi:MAG TPA: pyridoxamine 5'-phosphate oxidase family protein [Gemmatimonadaceae bacterium]|nr:pyridoxamine 5'-phosphate oxidase family protein [Gemmatimonadaceae bacterium]